MEIIKLSDNKYIDYYMKMGYSLKESKEIINSANKIYNIARKTGATTDFESWCYLLARILKVIPEKS